MVFCLYISFYFWVYYINSSVYFTQNVIQIYFIANKECSFLANHWIKLFQKIETFIVNSQWNIKELHASQEYGSYPSAGI